MSKADIANIVIGLVAVVCLVLWLLTPGWDLSKIMGVISSVLLFLCNLLPFLDRRKKKN